MKNETEQYDTFTFFVENDIYTVAAPDETAALLKMNRDVLGCVDKRSLHPMSWFSHDDDPTIPEKSYYLRKGNYFD